MFGTIAQLAVRRRLPVLVASALFLVLAAVVGGGVFGKLQGGGFEDPDAEWTRAAEILQDHFGAGDANLVLLVTASQGSVDDAAAMAAGRELTRRLGAEPEVSRAVSYWSLGKPPPLRSSDASKALVLVRIEGDEDAVDDALERIKPKYEGDQGPVIVEVGGSAAVFNEVAKTVESDLARAEAVAGPLTLVLLVVVFGSVVAALLPLAVGVIAVLGTFLSLSVIGSLTDVSIFSINLATALGLGLAIDYSLFIVSRFREELRSGAGTHDAVIRTVETAGRTIAFSALTVAVSLAALLIFPLYFLRSFAYAGIAVVLLAAAGALVSLPALLAVLGHRVNSLPLWRRPAPGETRGFWHRVAVTVMRHPVLVATPVVAVLLLVGTPFLGVKFGLPDHRVLPAGAESRQVSEQLRSDFSSSEADAFGVVAPHVLDPDGQRSAIDSYAATLSEIGGVARVDALTGSYIGGRQVAPPGPAATRFRNATGTWFSAVPAVEPVSPAGEEIVRTIRATDSPFEVLVAGASAELVDSKAALFARLPLAAAIIGVATFVLLFLMFGGLLVPVKAIVLNLLSLTATFGAMVWVFQEGHGADFLNFTPTGTLVTTVPILMFCIAFGLSMDYEVFLLSRIKEEYDHSGDNTASVAMGLERTGRIVTAAALVLSVTFVAFATSGVSFIKLMGLGLAVAVIVDATLIRGTLVPAFMRLAGDANWWAPRALRRIHERFGLRETGRRRSDDPPATA